MSITGKGVAAVPYVQPKAAQSDDAQTYKKAVNVNDGYAAGTEHDAGPTSTQDMMHTIRAAIEGGTVAPEQYAVPTVEEMMAEAMVNDPAGLTFIDGTNEQILLDIKLQFTELVMSKEEQMRTAPPSLQKTLLLEVKALQTQIEVVIPQEIKKLREAAEHFQATFRQEVELMKQVGRGEISAEQADLNGDGVPGNPLTSEYYIGEKDGEYAIIHEASGVPVRFDKLGNPLVGNIHNENYEYDLSKSNLQIESLHPTQSAHEHNWVMSAKSTSFSDKRLSHNNVHGPKIEYQAQIDIPMPETFWVAATAEGEPRIINGQYDVYVPELEPGDHLVLDAPPEGIRDNYIQIMVTDVRVSSEPNEYLELKDPDNPDKQLEPAPKNYNHVITFEHNGTKLSSMLLTGFQNGANPKAASEMSLALNGGTGLFGDDPNRTRTRPIGIHFEDNFRSQHNGGAVHVNGELPPDDSIKKTSYKEVRDQQHNRLFLDQDPKYATLQFFNTNKTSDMGFFGIAHKNGQSEVQDLHENREERVGAFVVDIPSGSVANGTAYNDFFTVRNPDSDLPADDPAYKTVLDTGGQFDAVFAESGDTYVRNATHFEKYGRGKEVSSVHTKEEITFRYRGKKYLIQPAVYVKIDTPGGKTFIDNPKEPPERTADEYFNVINESYAKHDKKSKRDAHKRRYDDDYYSINSGDVYFTDPEAYDIQFENSGQIDSKEMKAEFEEKMSEVSDAFAESLEVQALDADIAEADAWYKINSEYYNQSHSAMNDFFSSYSSAYGLNKYGEEEGSDEQVIEEMFDDKSTGALPPLGEA